MSEMDLEYVNEHKSERYAAFRIKWLMWDLKPLLQIKKNVKNWLPDFLWGKELRL